MAKRQNAQTGGVFDPSRDTVITGQILSNGPAGPPGAFGTGGIGYNDGAGARVTQITNRSTAVTINALCGLIITDSTSLAAEASAAFIVNNAAVEIGDVVVVSQRSGAIGLMTVVTVSTTTAGSFTLNVQNNNPAAGTAETGALQLNFAVIKAVSV